MAQLALAVSIAFRVGRSPVLDRADGVLHPKGTSEQFEMAVAWIDAQAAASREVQP